VLYPPDRLPPGLDVLAQALPLTPMLSGVRGALMEGQTLTALQPEIAHLGLFLICLAPLSAATLLYATRNTFDDGASPIS
ncbi:MAG: hypothetical protein AAFX99_24720, partial [Myxococcota bacterium]